MNHYGQIKSSLWVSSRKWRALKGDDAARLLYLYLHSSTHRNKILTYVLPMEYAALDLGWDMDTLRNGIDTLCHTVLIQYSVDESVVHIVGGLANDPPHNVKHAKAMLKDWEALPDCTCKWMSLKELRDTTHFPSDAKIETPDGYPFDTVSIPLGWVGTGKVVVASKDVPSKNSVPSEVEPDPEPGYPPWVHAVLDDWISVCPLPKAAKPEKCLKTFHDLQRIDGHPAEHVTKVCAYIVRNKAPTYIKSPMKLRTLNRDKDCQTFEMYATEMVNQGNGKVAGLQDPDPHRYQPKDFSSKYVRSQQPDQSTQPQHIGDLLEEGTP